MDMELSDTRLALTRYWRRCQLWHAARLACPDNATFRASVGAIERAVSRLLAEEFGDLTAT